MPQEGGGNARAWIEDPNAYPVKTNSPMLALGAGGVSGGYRKPFCKKCVVFVDNTFHALLTVLLGDFHTLAVFGVLSAKKTPQQF